MKYGIIVTMAALCLTVLGLASAQDAPTDLDSALAAITFRPIDDIIDQELIITGFANDGTATLPLTTSVPVACTLVYGTTPEFGQLTLDQDMAGGAHSDHSPLLTGLEPETEYFFRVQGVDDAGTIYISEVMTFTTPPLSTTETENLLSPERGAQILGVSSTFGNQEHSGRWGVLSALDGNPATAWSSDGDGDDAWFEVQLGQRSRIERVEFWTRFMNDGTAQAFEFTITTETGEVYGPFELPDADQPYEFAVSFEAETLRFDITNSSGGNTGAVEVAVYGEPVE
jgi:hypothetical protein